MKLCVVFAAGIMLSAMAIGGCASRAPQPAAAPTTLTNAEALPPMPLPEDRMPLSEVRTFEDPAPPATTAAPAAAPATDTQDEAKP